MDSVKNLRVLQKKWTACTKCSLSKMRPDDSIVFGRGTAPADYLFVSTWPNAEDEEFGQPFLGPDGEIMAELLKQIGMDPDDIFFTTVVACRPKVLIPATDELEERIEERQPDKEEVQSCLPRLNEIVYQVNPRIIIAFGLLPLQVLAVNGTRIRKIAGNTKVLYEAHVPGRVEPVRYPLIASVGMDMLVKNPSTASHGPLATTMAVLLHAKDYVAWIKEKEGLI